MRVVDTFAELLDAKGKPLQPFTLPHFKAWALRLKLDTDEWWVIEPFQAAFVKDLFAGREENWLIVPEGNAKTTLVAGLALYHCEYRPMASVPIAASSRDQAEILYRQAEGFVIRSPYLHKVIHSDVQEAKGKRKTDVPRFVPLEGHRRVNHAAGGRIQVFAADDRTGDGVIPTLAVVDELHRHRDLRLYRTWVGKLDKRKGQLVTISTSGEPGSDFEQTRERIRQTAKVTRKPCFVRAESETLVMHEWAVPEDGDVEDVKLVKKANPLKAITVPALRKKLGAPTMKLSHWRRMNCNLPTRSDDAAITEAEWEAAYVEDSIPKGEPIWLGLDIAWKWDTFAMVPYLHRSSEYRLLGPAVVLEPPRDGSAMHPSIPEKALTDINERNPIHTVVMDPSRGEQLATWKSDTFGATVIERNPRAQDVIEYDKFMEALRSGWLKHTGDEDLTQHAMNAIARTDRFGASRFDRKSPTRNASPDQDRRVIDALDAAAMVHAQASIQPEPEVEPMVAYR